MKTMLINLFIKSLPTDFLSFLGFEFIKKAYLEEFFKSPSNMIIVCKIDNELVAFLMACNSKKLIRNTISKHPFLFFNSAIKKMLYHPVKSFKYLISIVYFLIRNNCGFVLKEEHVELCYIGVRPDYQNQRLGSLLVSQLVKKCERQKKIIFVKTLLGNRDLAATKFYLKNGFTSSAKCAGRHFLVRKFG